MSDDCPYSDMEINEAVDAVISAAICIDRGNNRVQGSVNPNYKSRAPYDEPGELVERYNHLYPAIVYAKERHWNKRMQ